jgi:predicted transcriptional regulator
MQIEGNEKLKIQSFIEKIPAVHLSQNLGEALELLISEDLDKVAVLSESERFMGYIRYQEILELYFSKLRK